MNRMLIAPHGDDESWGAGGYLAKYPGTFVLVVAAFGGERLNQFEQAMGELGIVSYECMGRPDGRVGEHQDQLVRNFDWWLRQKTPDELLLPAPGTHQDHIAVYEAGMRAARRSTNDNHHQPPTVLLYDVPAYDLELYPAGHRWNVYEELDPVHLMRKGNAMACYDVVPDELHPAHQDNITATARLAGSEVGLLYAERFCAVRLVRR